MATNFRSEMFKLCKKLQNNENAHKIQETIYNMSVVVESKETGEMLRNPHGDFAYVAKHSNTEFHGYLFADDNIDKMKFPQYIKAEHLLEYERALIEDGHRTIMRFVELCLSDIASQSNAVAAAINPYYLYKEVAVSKNAKSLLSDDELNSAVAAFKNGIAYKTLMEANFTKLFCRIDDNSMRALFGVVEKEIDQSLGEDVTKDLRDFSFKLDSQLKNITDVMFAFSILMLALKMSLKLSCRLLYRAMCGIELFVLNNDNIIKIERRVRTTVSEFYKVFSQKVQVDYSGSEMGSLLLIDCDLPYDKHIHEFGMLVSETVNLVGEFGSSAKYSFVTVDENLICIHELVKEVLRVGIPTVN